MDGHKQARTGGAVAHRLNGRVVGPEDRGVLRDDVGERGRDCGPGGETMTVFKQVVEYPFDPGGGRGGVVWVDVGKVAAYLGPGLRPEVV